MITGYLELVKSINGDGLLKSSPFYFTIHMISLICAHSVIGIYICCPNISLSDDLQRERGERDPNGQIYADPRVNLISFDQLQLKNQSFDSNFEGHQTCSICLEDFHHGQVIKSLPLCPHLFHETCLKSWYETSF